MVRRSAGSLTPSKGQRCCRLIGRGRCHRAPNGPASLVVKFFPDTATSRCWWLSHRAGGLHCFAGRGGDAHGPAVANCAQYDLHGTPKSWNRQPLCGSIVWLSSAIGQRGRRLLPALALAKQRRAREQHRGHRRRDREQDDDHPRVQRQPPSSAEKYTIGARARRTTRAACWRAPADACAGRSLRKRTHAQRRRLPTARRSRPAAPRRRPRSTRHGAHSITSPRRQEFGHRGRAEEAEQRDQQRRYEIHVARVADAEHQHDQHAVDVDEVKRQHAVLRRRGRAAAASARAPSPAQSSRSRRIVALASKGLIRRSP